MAAMRAAGQANTSSESTIRSARLPGSSDPCSASRPMERAFQIVKARTASARVMRCSGCQPGSSPSRGARVTAAWRPWKGLASSTGKSEPPATYEPASRIDRHA